MAVVFHDGDEHDNWTAALDLVAAGRGVLPAPVPLVDMVRRPDVAFVPLDVTLAMTYGIVWSAEHASTHTLAVVQAIQDHLRTGGRSRVLSR